MASEGTSKKAESDPLEAALVRLETAKFKSPAEAQAALLSATVALSNELAPHYVETGIVAPEPTGSGDRLMTEAFTFGHPVEAVKSFVRSKSGDVDQSKTHALMTRYVNGARRLYDDLAADEFQVSATVGIPPSVTISLTWRRSK